MSRLFSRRWKVTVGANSAISTADLRITFKARRTLEKEPNTLNLQITNLSENSRGKLNAKALPVILEAGYEGNTGVIFSGDSRTIDHIRDGADWATKISCGDGEQAYTFTRVNESFGPNYSVAEAIRTVAGKLQINTGNLEDMLAGPLAITTFKHGYAAFGPASQVFDKLIAAAGLRWSIQNGAIQVRRKDAPVQATAFRLSAESGLLGSPEYAAPDKKKGPTVLKVKALLNPKLLPGYIVALDANTVKGEFLMRTVEHQGDSHGADWFTLLECVARNNE